MCVLSINAVHFLSRISILKFSIELHSVYIEDGQLLIYNCIVIAVITLSHHFARENVQEKKIIFLMCTEYILPCILNLNSFFCCLVLFVSLNNLTWLI